MQAAADLPSSEAEGTRAKAVIVDSGKICHLCKVWVVWGFFSYQEEFDCSLMLRY